MIGHLRFTQYFLVSAMLVLAGVVSHAEQTQSSEVDNKAYWICKNKKEVRTVRVHVSEQGICSTLYSRDGSEKSIGSGKNQESCLKILDNVKTNLEKSNWACRDISSTKITANVN